MTTATLSLPKLTAARRATAAAALAVGRHTLRGKVPLRPKVSWPLHDIIITNSVWCIAYKREVGREVVYCPIIVQSYCTRVGNSGGRGE